MELLGARTRTFDSSLYHISAEEDGWHMEYKKTGEKKVVSYFTAPKDADEMLLAGVAYGVFHR